jgi:multicomponent Na+:H+ antiporter subunit B
MDVIVRTTAKGLFPFVLLLGIYIILHGHLTPGGSFPGGTIIAAGAALIVIAFGMKRLEKPISERRIHLIKGLAGVILVSVIVFESFVRGYLLPTGKAFEIWGAQQVLFLNIAGGVMVATALILIVFLIARM